MDERVRKVAEILAKEAWYREAGLSSWEEQPLERQDQWISRHEYLAEEIIDALGLGIDPELLARAEEVWPQETAIEWLYGSNADLGGDRPIDVWNAGHTGLVFKMLEGEKGG